MVKKGIFGYSKVLISGKNSQSGTNILTMAKLVRSSRKVIAGVCGGIAEYLDWDPVWVRILFILLSVATAVLTGVIVYVVLWVAMPEGE
jgi:phage shock protein PspC (stress-responsive transcriptional regulator)